MKVLVTGAHGFIGSHLVERLTALGLDVRAFSRSGGSSAPYDNRLVESFVGDLRDEESVHRAVADCELVYHVAAVTRRLRSARHHLYDVNQAGTSNLAGACLRAGVKRLVFCSSCGVYGVPKCSPTDESVSRRPNTPYRLSKKLAEDIVLGHFRLDGLPVVVARLASVNGPRGRSGLGLWQSVAAGGFRMIEPGRNRVSLVDVDDVVAGLIACGETAGIEGEAFNLSGEAPVLVRDYIEMIAQRLGVPLAPSHSPSFPFFVYSRLDTFLFRRFRLQLARAHDYEMFVTDRAFVHSKARDRLGYLPRRTTAESLDRTMAWYRQEDLVRPLRGS